jgi:hypothetical protein
VKWAVIILALIVLQGAIGSVFDLSQEQASLLNSVGFCVCFAGVVVWQRWRRR